MLIEEGEGTNAHIVFFRAARRQFTRVLAEIAHQFVDFRRVFFR